MRVVLYLGNLEVGGAQHSTIDLAAGLGRLGHEVVLVAPPGPLEPVARGRGVRLHLVADEAVQPSRRRVGAIAHAIGVIQPDVVVSFGDAAAIEALAGAGAGQGVAVVCGYPSQELSKDAPRTTPVIARRQAVLIAARGRNPVVVDIPAAVDTEHNRPGIDGSAFRQAHAGEGESLVVLVSRLARVQKAPGLLLATEAAAVLAGRRPFRLVIVGDGGMREDVEARADLVGDVVRVVGELPDPRAAYAAADVVLGLGTSVLRAMAQGRPAIVLGEEGAIMAVEPDTVGGLAAVHWFAPGPPASPVELADLVEALLDDPERARQSAEAGRQVVVAERDGTVVARLLEPVLAEAVARGVSRPVAAFDATRSWVGAVVRLHLRRTGRRVRHRLRRWSRSPGSTTSS